MGMGVFFYVERAAPGGFEFLGDLSGNTANEWGSPVALGCLWKPRLELIPVFSDRHFQLRYGVPPDASPEMAAAFGSCPRVARSAEMRSIEGLTWLPVEELMLQDWSGEYVLVGGSIEARHAALFGDGRGRYPEVALAAVGAAARKRLIVHESIDRHGLLAHEHHAAHPDAELAVTWRASLAEVAGPTFMGSVAAPLLALGDLSGVRLMVEVSR